MSHGPVQAQYRERLNRLAAMIDTFLNGEELPRRIGFALFMFEFNKAEGGRVNYISNGDRAEMIGAVKEWLARAEGRLPPNEARQ